MSISFDSALGVHEKALAIYSRRAELLASNLANADTPGYKARDIDFKAALQNSLQLSASSSTGHPYSRTANLAGQLETTRSNHIQTAGADRVSISDAAIEIQYRQPDHASLDGNTVDSQAEKSRFAENALRYQASLSFLDGKFKGMMAALKGE